MRVMTLFALVLTTAAGAVADDKADRVRRVKVALALTAAEEVCGKCREDATQAWEDALAGRKPIVLFVGGPCDGLGQAACQAGAVAVKVEEYAGDASQRIVVGRPKADGSGFDAVSTLPAKTTPKEVTAAVKEATPKADPPKVPAVAKVDWFIK